MKKRLVPAISLICLLAFERPAESDAAEPTTAPRLPADSTATPGDERNSSTARIADAVRVVNRMKVDPEVREILNRATGLFIVPEYDRSAMRMKPRVPGVLVVRRGEGWSDPLFYEVGPIVLGAHAGADIDALAAILLSEQAVSRFASGRTFSLSLDGGFNMANHAAQAGPFPDEGDDAIMWSNAAGLFPGAAVRLDRIRPDEVGNTALHGPDMLLEQAVRAEPTVAEARPLHSALAD